MSDGPAVHFSGTGWSPAACGIAGGTYGLCGTADRSKVTCADCIRALDAAPPPPNVREETDEEFRARVTASSAAGDAGPFSRRLINVE